MNLGILMSLFNQRYFRDNLSTMCAASPCAALSCDAPCRHDRVQTLPKSFMRSCSCAVYDEHRDEITFVLARWRHAALHSDAPRIADV